MIGRSPFVAKTVGMTMFIFVIGFLFSDYFEHPLLNNMFSGVMAQLGSINNLNPKKKHEKTASPVQSQSKKRRYTKPLNSRDVDVSITSEWPTSNLSPLCEAWAHLDDLASLSSQSKLNDLKWIFLDTLSDLSSEKKILLDSVFLNTESTPQHGGYWSYQDSIELALQSTKRSNFIQNQQKDISMESFDEEEQDNMSTRLLKYALSLRAHSPLCELHRTMARDLAIQSGLYNPTEISTSAIPVSFAVIHPTGIVIDSVQDLTHFVQTYLQNEDEDYDNENKQSINFLPNELPRSWTEKSGNDSSNDATLKSQNPTVVLYTHVGTSIFSLYYNELKRLGVDFVVRHMGVIDYEERMKTKSHERISIRENSLMANKTILQGYGIRLDIKNMEYRAYEDEGYHVEDDERTKAQNFTLSNSFLAGLNVSKFVSRTNAGDDESSLASIINLQTKLQQSHDQQHEMEKTIPPTWQTRILPLQAATVISTSKDPLFSLQDIAQNLPSRASSLVNIHVPKRIQSAAEEIENFPLLKSRDLHSHPGPFGFYVNGKRIYVERPSFNIFELLNTLRSEDMILSEMEASFDLSTPEMYQALQKAFEMGDDLFKSSEQKRTSTNPLMPEPPKDDRVRVDVGRGGKDAIIYVNNIETDPQYSQYLPNLQMLAYGVKQVRKNLLTFMIVVDPLSGHDVPALRFALYLMQSNLPVRVGFLFVNDEDIKSYSEFDDKIEWTGPKLSKINKANEPVTTGFFVELFKTTLAKYGGHASLSFLFHMIETFEEMREKNTLKDLNVQVLLTHYAQYFMSIYNQDITPMLDSLKESLKSNKHEYSKNYVNAIKFASSKNIKQGLSFMNGIPLPKAAKTDKENKKFFQQRAIEISNEETQHITMLVMNGVLTDRTRSVYANLLTGKNVHKKFHTLFLEGSNKGKTYINSQVLDELAYSIAPSKQAADSAFITIDAVLDLESTDGLLIAEKFINIMTKLPGVLSKGKAKVSIRHRILPSKFSATSLFFGSILSQQGVDQSAVVRALQEFYNKIHSSIKERKDIMQEFHEFIHDFSDISAEGKQSIVTAMDNIEMPPEGKVSTFPNKNMILANGRALDVDISLNSFDIELLIDVEKQQAKSLTDIFRAHSSSEIELYSVVMQTSIYFSNSEDSEERKNVQLFPSRFESNERVKGDKLHFEWNEDSSAVVSGDRIMKTKVTVIMDPLSEPAQRVAPILIAIRDGLKIPLHLILAPRTHIDGNEGLPLNSYYRFFANFEHDGGPAFQNLPSNHVLTLRTDVPEPWNVQKLHAIQDTDNLRCDVDFACGDDGFLADSTGDDTLIEGDQTRVEFGLNGLMFFGQCYDAGAGDHPNGLQLTLTREKGPKVYNANKSQATEVEILDDGTVSRFSTGIKDENTHFSDTLVMKNLGYWQLRANPGIWNLEIAKETVGAELFEIQHGETKNGEFIPSEKSELTSSKTIVMKDFVSRGEILFVQQTSDNISPDMSLGESLVTSSSSDNDDIIHVFSLATGHLYERLLKIMMLSVTKRASVRVKFWLFENFLSPGFKSSALAMAEEIGCDIEFVTYKWPEWLRGQSEMQRIIWGYKILFLDVLFPLDVKKIIYVDADQVVRADLKELRDLDLQGAPYGYTPFCDSRETTLGFQFWRTGFWENHLRGKPYHISALYVVDLERFRKEKVGDTLRGIYQMLSADSGSLANLDQDLPNYAQHEVKIHSLPQEWLWCESWCADSTKKKAKTIDLCNNPLHKEPKITMAKRVISGNLFKESWVELDEEVARYENKSKTIA